jgi:hypothetical protein
MANGIVASVSVCLVKKMDFSPDDQRTRGRKAFGFVFPGRIDFTGFFPVN